MREEFSKSVKKKLRELVLEAHEKALRAPLEELSRHCDRWRSGEISAIDFADLIHDFSNGPSREIYKRFTWSSYNDLPVMIAGAIHDGLLDEEAIPDDVMATSVGRWMAMIRADEQSRRKETS